MTRRPVMLGYLWLAWTAGCFSPTDSGSPSETSSDATTSDSSGTLTASSSNMGATSTSSSTSSTTQPDTSTATDPSTGHTCGDGVLDDGEECDDKGTDDGDGCSHSCLKEFRRVFVTSDLYTGDLEGVAGADAKCQDAAIKVGFKGTFRAWLSSSEGTPAQTFIRSDVPYHDVMDTKVADDWDDLTTGNLKSGIYLTETGEAATSGPHPCMPSDIVLAWSNTYAEGILQSEAQSCTSWTGEGEGAVGRVGVLNSAWTQSCVVPCTTMAPLYCFEQ